MICLMSVSKAFCDDLSGIVMIDVRLEIDCEVMLTIIDILCLKIIYKCAMNECNFFQ